MDSKEPIRKIIIIETPPWMKVQQQIAWMASDEELAAAKLERPDLIFREPLPDEGVVTENEEAAEVIEPTDMDMELTPHQKHILEIYSKPMSIHGIASDPKKRQGLIVVNDSNNKS